MKLDRRVYQGMWATAAIGASGLAVGMFVSLRHALHAYLAAWCFATTVALGCLFFILFHHVTAARWSTVVRRLAEHVVAAMPVLAVGVLVILFGVPYLYEWSGDRVDPLLEHKRAYLNMPFFAFRVIVYVATWAFIARKMRRWSFQQDVAEDPELTIVMRRWSAPALIILALTLSFASFDLLMSLDYAWYSTIFGVYVFSGGVVAGYAMLALLSFLLRGSLAALIVEDTRHDLGKWLFAFAIFWMYIAFSQFMLIYYANIPEETAWMTHRWDGSWAVVSVFIVMTMFVFPFVALMSATAKKTYRILVPVSVVILVGHFVEMIALVMPSLHSKGYEPALTWIDASALAFIVGTCGVAVLRSMTRAALVPIGDPVFGDTAAPPVSGAVAATRMGHPK